MKLDREIEVTVKRSRTLVSQLVACIILQQVVHLRKNSQDLNHDERDDREETYWKKTGRGTGIL